MGCRPRSPAPPRCVRAWNSSQTFESSNCKNFFPSVYVVGTACFDEYFLFHVMIARHIFYSLNILEVLWKKSVFYVLYLHKNIIMLLIPKVQLRFLILKFSEQILFLNFFLHSFILCECSRFFCMEFFKA